MLRRLIIVGRGPTAERVAELGGQLGYDELKVCEEPVADLSASDHLIIAADEPIVGRELLLAAVRAEVMPAYLGYAATHREGWKALVRLAAENIPKARIDAVSAPAGVDVGAETPEEVAIAVAAELVALRRGRVRPSAGLAIEASRRPPLEARPRRLIGRFARPAHSEDDDDKGNGQGSGGRN